MSNPFPPNLLSTVPSPLPSSSTLTPPTLSTLLTLYASLLTHVSSTKSRRGWKSLQQLDALRYELLPTRVRGRRNTSSKDGKGKKSTEGGEGWLEKEEVEDLMAWKLTRGKFRPTLLPLIKSNASALITSTTREAFSLFASDPSNPLPALKKLAELKGVGPATSSLLLAVAFEEEVPFFADEILGWLRDGEVEKLKYDWKEYKEVWEGVRGVRERLDGASAVAVERGAWVVEMVRVMGLEGGGEGKMEEDSDAKVEGGIKQKGAGGFNQDADDDGEAEEEDVCIKKEAKPTPYTKVTGKDANRTGSRTSAREKRKLPPSDPPSTTTTITTKKPKNTPKASRRTSAGEN